MRKIDERTTALGLFHYAISYWKSAEYLSKNKLKVTHQDAPVTFLYYHAIELFLKAYLRQKKLTVKELKNISHDIIILTKEAANRGLFLMDEDKIVFQYMNRENIFGARYIKTGYFEIASKEALNRTCENLYEAIRPIILTP
jgi:hypothetical protein